MSAEFSWRLWALYEGEVTFSYLQGIVLTVAYLGFMQTTIEMAIPRAPCEAWCDRTAPSLSDSGVAMIAPGAAGVDKKLHFAVIVAKFVF